jgi:hypothetical protein
VQHGGRGDRHLGRAAGGHLRLQVFEVGLLDVLGVAHLVDHADHRRRQFLAAVRLPDGDRDVGLDATELLEEVDVEVGAAELAVGDALQAHVFLELHDLGDGLVFHLAQLLGRDLALGLLGAGFEQVLRAQEAADMVVAGGEFHHGVVSLSGKRKL